MEVELDIGQQPFQQVKDLMTIYHSLLHNVHLQVFQALKEILKLICKKKKDEFLTDIYERVPMNVCNVESINCALTPKSHNFISP
jgi:hypothetical protein